MEHKAVVYGKPHCMQCDYTKKVLDKQGTPYLYIDIEQNGVASQELKTMGYSGLPVVVAGPNPENRWSGFKPDKLRKIGK